MDRRRLGDVLSRFPGITILVVGDFFLDKYLIIEQTLAERSLETGLEAHQVVQIRCSPGAAGTVTSNLRALDVAVIALSAIGDDGHGYELTRALEATGVNTDNLLTAPERFTPTYTKPMQRSVSGLEHELNRLDIKNRRPLNSLIEDEILARLRRLAPTVQAVIVADQVEERNCGIITDRIRCELAALAGMNPQVVFAADSRERIGLYRHVVTKPNAREATRAVYPDRTEGLAGDELMACGHTLWQRTGKPVFLTRGDQGLTIFHDGGPTHVPAVPVSGPIDIVGAGDATMSGMTAALAVGASLAEAAGIGVCAAAVTIKQIGTTGTATRADIARIAPASDLT